MISTAGMLTSSKWCLTVAMMLIGVQGAKAENHYPRLIGNSAPLLTDAPTIDGRVELREWTCAQQLPPLIRSSDGQLDTNRTESYIGYTEEALYIAWRVYRSAESGPMRISANTPGKHEGRAVWLDDTVEIFLDINGDGKRAVSFAGNAASAYGDGLASGTTDFTHSWNWQYQARETDFGWEGELKIGFKDLGLDGPPDASATWGFDLARNNVTPDQEVAYISFRENWHDRSKYSRLTFGGGKPLVRLREFGSIGDESVGILAESINTSDQDADIEVEYTIYQRRPEVSAFNFFQQVDAGVSNRATQDILTTATVEQQLEAALGLYRQLKHERLTRHVPAGGRAILNMASKAAVGDYLIGYKFRLADGSMLAEGLLPATRWDPLHVEIVPYYLKADLIDVNLTIHSGDVRSRINDITCRMLQNDKTVLETHTTLEGASSGIDLSTKDIVPGQYRLEVIAVDDAGNTLSQFSRDLHRPEPPFWAVKQYGFANFVPEPWTPVEASDNKASVWGRDYHFDKAFLPRQIVSQGHELLAAPPRLLLRMNNKEVSWEGKLRLAEKNIEYVDYVWEGSAGTIPVQVRTRVEFDGFITIDLGMNTNGVTIDQFFVEFPLRPEQAQLYSVKTSLNVRPLTSKVAQTGMLTNSFSVDFVPGLWLGNTERGLQWCAEVDQYWHNRSKSRAIEVVKDADETVVRLRVIDQPYQTPQRIEYRWGLVASPVKEYDLQRTRDLYYAQYAIQEAYYKNEPKAVQAFKKQLMMGQKMGANWANTFRWLTRYDAPVGPGTFGEPYLENPAHIEAHRAAVKLIHEHGMKTTAYTGWNGLHPNMSWWPFFGEAMKRTPSRFTYGGYKGCSRAGFGDYLANGLAWMIQTLGIEGVYLDGTASMQPCYERHHGCGYTDPKTGQRVITYNIWPQRELFKRMYKITHGEVIDDGLIYSHSGGSPMLAIESFVDIRHGSEGDTLEEYLDLDSFRTKYYGRMYGLPLELTWVYHAPPNLVWGVGMLHDTPIKMYYHLFADRRSRSDNYDKAHIGWKMWAPRQWFDWEAGYEWHPYYNNSDVLTISKSSVKASFHLNKKGQMIFIALNTDEAQNKAMFAFELSKLGLPGVLHARDAVTDEELKITNGEFELNILGHRPRVLMIDVAPVPEVDLNIVEHAP